STEGRRPERRDLLSTISRLSWTEGLSAPRFALRSRRRKVPYAIALPLTRNIPIRRLFLLVLSLGLLAFAVQAQSFPTKPFRLVIPYQPGGGTDILVRAIVPEVTRTLGQQIMIDNKPGGASIVGTQMVVDAAPDGYMILATDSALLVNPGLFKSKLPYD